MTDFFNDIVVGPLSDNYCMLYYYLTIFAFVIFVAGCFLILAVLLQKNVSFIQIFMIMSNVFIYYIFYLENRILYNMCRRVLLP